MIVLENKDCLDFIGDRENSSSDLIIVDPPYFIGYDGGDGWDNQWNSEQHYLDWCADWTSELVRTLKDGRMMIVWGTLKTDTFLKYKLEVLNSFKELHPQNEIIWSYNWGGRSKKNFARKHEVAWCYSKGKEFLFNGDDVRIERRMKVNPRTGEPFSKGTIPTCVWEFNNHTTSKDFVNWHPTTKNLDVTNRMVLAYSNKNDTVVDIFSGSGTTALAAKNNSRRFVGCEVNEEYYKKSLERLQIV